MMRVVWRVVLAGLLGAGMSFGHLGSGLAQSPVIPHGQDRPPNPPRTPQEAIRHMTVPPGFHVELVAAEPDLVNPVAMTFDEKGRIWITESVEYPRHSAGPGRDRIKIFESTKGDGHYDKVTLFAEGLNIPSGIALGYGGVWVANAPDILFYRLGADGKPLGRPEVVVSGFGRSDTHEVPNSLTWGPDGWLYGLNGVFNPSRIVHRGRVYEFTCALFRLHPRSRDFEVFCEGTSNPWGLAFDPEGSAFVSACVVDHLWHLVQTGYYIRQSGPYPPFTWPIGSIVRHRHQKAAYCGLHYFDSPAYPPEYRGKLYMGNIHGNCINCDELERDGATYLAKPRPDFLQAHDAWFMPVAQRTGPDGCLYILDWYDRYHCYQDASRDPGGIDRERGRLYRVVYGSYRPAGRFDLGQESEEQLLLRLGDPNIYFRETAQRLLTERLAASAGSTRGRRLAQQLQARVLDPQAPQTARRHALWVLVGAGPLDAAFQEQLLRHPDPTYRAWGVRAAGNARQVPAALRTQLLALAADPSPDVRLQVAIAAPRLAETDPLPVLLQVLRHSPGDKLIPHIVWQNLHPLLASRVADFARQARYELPQSPALRALLPRVVERLLAVPQESGVAAVSDLLACLANQELAEADDLLAACLAQLTQKVVNGELRGPSQEALRQRLQPTLALLRQRPRSAVSRQEGELLAAALHETSAYAPAAACLSDRQQPPERRLRALEALLVGGDPQALTRAAPLLADPASGPPQFRNQLLLALQRTAQPEVAQTILELYPRLEETLKPSAIELLTQRPAWAKLLLTAIGQKKLSPQVLNLNQVRRLLASRDPELTRQVTAYWGTVRDQRNPQREQVIAHMRRLLESHSGDPHAGWQVFKKLCAQCHKIYGEGADVGPDLTANGRGSFEQLLSNVFDPNLVIGPGYQATTVVTRRGQVFTGLLAEDSPQRLVLKMQGDKQEIIPREDIDSVEISKVSLMPEQLEQQLQPQEIVDLFAFLTLDRPPTDPQARPIPGTPTRLLSRARPR
jgi:putative heme-binding domain-containing protein